MLVNKSIIFAVLFSAACGESQPTINDDWEIDYLTPEPDPVDFQEPEPELRELLDDFIYDCSEVHGVRLPFLDKLESIEYGETRTEKEPNRVGYCRWWCYDGDIEKTIIRIDPDLDRTTLTFKGLMYHEFGHCIMGHSHTDPGTIMAPILASETYYEENWDSMVEHLCTARPTNPCK